MIQMERAARISECGKYRYTLLRRWGNRPKGVTWVMLNPSTADDTEDDNTIRKCMEFTKRWGYDAMLVVNLFALRATDPRKLEGQKEPWGPENAGWVAQSCRQADMVVAGWGSVKPKMRTAAEITIGLIREAGFYFKCLGANQDGSPKHPLYLKYDTRLMLWPRSNP